MIPLVVFCIGLGQAVPPDQLRRLQKATVKGYLDWVEKNMTAFGKEEVGRLIGATAVVGDATVFNSQCVVSPMPIHRPFHILPPKRISDENRRHRQIRLCGEVPTEGVWGWVA